MSRSDVRGRHLGLEVGWQVHQNGLNRLVGRVHEVYFLGGPVATVHIVEFDMGLFCQNVAQFERITARIIHHFFYDNAFKSEYQGLFLAASIKGYLLVEMPHLRRIVNGTHLKCCTGGYLALWICYRGATATLPYLVDAQGFPTLVSHIEFCRYRHAVDHLSAIDRLANRL